MFIEGLSDENGLNDPRKEDTGMKHGMQSWVDVSAAVTEKPLGRAWTQGCRGPGALRGSLGGPACGAGGEGLTTGCPTPYTLPWRRCLLFQRSPVLWRSGVAGVAVSNPVRYPTVSAGGMSCGSQGMGVLPAPIWKSGLAVWSTGATREWSASSPCVSWGSHQE